MVETTGGVRLGGEVTTRRRRSVVMPKTAAPPRIAWEQMLVRHIEFNTLADKGRRRITLS